MVLECLSPCEDLLDYVERYGGTLSEDVAWLVMWHVLSTWSVSLRHQAGQPLDQSWNPWSQADRLWMWGSDEGNWLWHSGVCIIHQMCTFGFQWWTEPYPTILKLNYQTKCLSFRHSRVFSPEYDMEGRYYGKPATVWSLKWSCS